MESLAIGALCGVAAAVVIGAAFWFGIGPVEYLIDRDTLHHI
ncbi:hypothetical protein [Mycobacterium sp. NS-7484]|nr:hypothetical protein [Mycobacterium sp. NS-7484]